MRAERDVDMEWTWTCCTQELARAAMRARVFSRVLTCFSCAAIAHSYDAVKAAKATQFDAAKQASVGGGRLDAMDAATAAAQRVAAHQARALEMQQKMQEIHGKDVKSNLTAGDDHDGAAVRTSNYARAGGATIGESPEAAAARRKAQRDRDAEVRRMFSRR